MEIEVVRNSDDGIETLGNLFVISNEATIFKCDTLELPYKDNQHQISCIPRGIYTCIKIPASHIPYEHISITNVPNREGVCIHKANFVGQLLGCIAVAMNVSDINNDGEKDLSDSKTAFDKMMEILPNEFKLTIK